MSEAIAAVSPLAGAHFEGVVTIQAAPPQGMLTLRGAPGAFAGLLDAGLLRAVPGERQIMAVPDGAVGWMSPDEMLLLCPYAQADARLAEVEAAVGAAHVLAVNVSDARAMITLTGEGAALRTTLAKLTPADTREKALGLGELRRSRLAQVPAAFWFEDDRSLRLICFRSVAQYVFDLLRGAARPSSRAGAARALKSCPRGRPRSKTPPFRTTSGLTRAGKRNR